MAISARKGKVTTNTYDVSGDTLAEIWADIQKNGPTYNGKKRAGLTTCEANMDASSSKMEFTTTESEAKMTAGTLTCDCTIQMPKLKSDKKLSAAAKKEWARFMMELKAHENEHVADFVKTATQIGKDIDKLTAKGQGADKKASDKAAMAEYTTAFDQKFSDTENSKRLNAGADALDTGGHGPTLNTSIP